MRKNRKQKVTPNIISQWKDIKQKPTTRKIRRRARSIKKLDFDSLTTKDICEFINKSFPFQIEVFPQKPTPPGRAIWRAVINNKDIGYKPYTKIEDISYRKSPDKYGRCNLIGDPVFYGADGLNVAASEVCRGRLTKTNSAVYLTVGEWKLKEDTTVSIICHSRTAHKRSGDLIIAYQSLLALKKKSAKSKSEIRQWKLINRFLAYEFSKEVPSGEENKYMFSAAYSHSLLKSKKSFGIFYPSVGYRFYGHNAAYSTKLVDEGKLVLEKAHYIKCTFVSKKRPPKIETIASTDKIQGGLITW
jgi:hypothetical protein